MKKILIIFPVLLLLSGCGILSTEPYIKTYFFDIGSPAARINAANFKVDNITFSTASMYRQKMVFRIAPSTVLFDEYNRWSMSPDALIRRSFVMAVADNTSGYQDDKIPHYSIEGQIMMLEADIPGKSVSLALLVSLYDTRKSRKLVWTHLFVQKKPVQKITGQSFAKAVRELVDNIINEVDVLIEKNIK